MAFNPLPLERSGPPLGHARVWPVLLGLLVGLLAPAMLFPAEANGAVGEMIVLKGRATVIRGNRTIVVRRRLVVESGDRVRTGAGGKGARERIADGEQARERREVDKVADARTGAGVKVERTRARVADRRAHFNPHIVDLPATEPVV